MTLHLESAFPVQMTHLHYSALSNVSAWCTVSHKPCLSHFPYMTSAYTLLRCISEIHRGVRKYIRGQDCQRQFIRSSEAKPLASWSFPCLQPTPSRSRQISHQLTRHRFYQHRTIQRLVSLLCLAFNDRVCSCWVHDGPNCCCRKHTGLAAAPAQLWLPSPNFHDT